MIEHFKKYECMLKIDKEFHSIFIQDRKKFLAEILDLSKLIISKIDQKDLMSFYGMKSDPRPDAATIKRSVWLLPMVYL